MHVQTTKKLRSSRRTFDFLNFKIEQHELVRNSCPKLIVIIRIYSTKKFFNSKVVTIKTTVCKYDWFFLLNNIFSVISVSCVEIVIYFGISSAKKAWKRQLKLFRHAQHVKRNCNMNQLRELESTCCYG